MDTPASEMASQTTECPPPVTDDCPKEPESSATSLTSYSLDELYHLSKSSLCKRPQLSSNTKTPLESSRRRRRDQVKLKRGGLRPEGFESTDQPERSNSYKIATSAGRGHVLERQKWERGAIFRSSDFRDRSNGTNHIQDGSRSQVPARNAHRGKTGGGRRGLPEWMSDDVSATTNSVDHLTIGSDGLDELQRWKQKMRQQERLGSLEEMDLRTSPASGFPLFVASTSDSVASSLSAPPGLSDGRNLPHVRTTQMTKGNVPEVAFGKSLHNLRASEHSKRAAEYSGAPNPYTSPDSSHPPSETISAPPSAQAGNKLKSKFSSFFRMQDDSRTTNRPRYSTDSGHGDQDLVSESVGGEGGSLGKLLNSIGGRHNVNSASNGHEHQNYGSPPPGLPIPPSFASTTLSSRPGAPHSNSDDQKSMGLLLESLSKGIANLKTRPTPNASAEARRVSASLSTPSRIPTETDILAQMGQLARSPQNGRTQGTETNEALHGGRQEDACAPAAGSSQKSMASLWQDDGKLAMNRILSTLEESRSTENSQQQLLYKHQQPLQPQRRQQQQQQGLAGRKEDGELMSKLMGLSAAAEAGHAGLAAPLPGVDSPHHLQGHLLPWDQLHHPDAQLQSGRSRGQGDSHVPGAPPSFFGPPSSNVSRDEATQGQAAESQPSGANSGLTAKKGAMVFGGNVPTSLLRRMVGKVEAVRPGDSSKDHGRSPARLDGPKVTESDGGTGLGPPGLSGCGGRMPGASLEARNKAGHGQDMFGLGFGEGSSGKFKPFRTGVDSGMVVGAGVDARAVPDRVWVDQHLGMVAGGDLRVPHQGPHHRVPAQNGGMIPEMMSHGFLPGPAERGLGLVDERLGAYAEFGRHLYEAGSMVPASAPPTFGPNSDGMEAVRVGAGDHRFRQARQEQLPLKPRRQVLEPPAPTAPPAVAAPAAQPRQPQQQHGPPVVPHGRILPGTTITGRELALNLHGIGIPLHHPPQSHPHPQPPHPPHPHPQHEIHALNGYPAFFPPSHVTGYADHQMAPSLNVSDLGLGLGIAGREFLGQTGYHGSGGGAQDTSSPAPNTGNAAAPINAAVAGTTTTITTMATMPAVSLTAPVVGALELGGRTTGHVPRW